MHTTQAKTSLSLSLSLKIYVNEFLPSDMGALLTRTRTRAKELCYKYTWVRAGKIAARRAESQSTIFIQTFDDPERGWDKPPPYYFSYYSAVTI